MTIELKIGHEHVAADLVTACQRLVARGTKPTLPEVRPLVAAYYALPNNGAGGDFHCVLDDGNYERYFVRSGMDRAHLTPRETRALGVVLLLLSNSQRRRL